MATNINKFILFSGSALIALGIVLPLCTSWAIMGQGLRVQDLTTVAGEIGSGLVGLGILVAASAFFYHYHSVHRAYVKFVIPLVMIGISIGISLAVVEIVLHLQYRNVQVGGVNSPSGITFYPKYYKYNSWGFRDTERERIKPDGTFRILVLGDSFTFGAGVKFKEQLYPALLEQKLNDSSLNARHFEVINTGLKGLSTADEIRYLLESGLELKPDLIIVGHVLNDAETPNLKHVIESKSRNATFLPAKYHRILNSYSFTYYLIRINVIKFVRSVADSKKGLTDYDAYLESLYRGDNLIAYKRVVANLARICDKNGLAVLWVSFPRIWHARTTPYPFLHVTDTVRGIALSNHFQFLDLQPAIKVADAQRLTVSAWDGHPNEVVHSIAAAEIYRRLIADKLIPISPDI